MSRSSFIRQIKKRNAWDRLKTHGLFLLLIIAFSGCVESDTDLFITPYNYQGKVTVIFDHPEGVPEKFIGKERIFDIGASGILRTKGKRKRGHLYNPKFYYRSADNRLHEMITIEMLIRNPGLATLPGVKFDSLIVEVFHTNITTSKGGAGSIEAITYRVRSRD